MSWPLNDLPQTIRNRTFDEMVPVWSNGDVGCIGFLQCWLRQCARMN